MMENGGDESKAKGAKRYTVGYGKPPAHSQFAKGKSGNPKGRPQGSKNKPVELQGGAFRDLFLREADRPLPGQQSGRVTMVEAVVRRTFADAIRGKAGAQKLILQQMAEISHADQELETEFTKTMMEAKVNGEMELARRARLNLMNEPELVPHPNDIGFDAGTGEVKVRGLSSKDEREYYARKRATAKVLREGLEGLATMIASEKSAPRRKELEQFRSVTQAKLDEIEDALSF